MKDMYIIQLHFFFFFANVKKIPVKFANMKNSCYI